MQLNEYQQQAETYALTGAKGLMYLVPGLAAEAGEVAGKWAKYLRDGQFRDHVTLREDMKKELGDCLWFIAIIAEQFNLSLTDVAVANLEKLEDRKQRNQIGGSGDDR